MSEWQEVIMLAQTAGIVFAPILVELAKESAKDFAKDYCKGALKNVLAGRNEWKQATVRALKAFLEQTQDELIGAGETDESAREYLAAVKTFLGDSAVKEELGTAITTPEIAIDYWLLQKRWGELQLKLLPDGFDWQKLCRRYQNKARTILRESDKLRELINAQLMQETADATQRLAGVDPGFDLSRYRDGLLKRYGYLKLETLDANPDHQRMALTKIFIPQTVRSCQQFNPRVYEMPAEYRRRLQSEGKLEQIDDEQEVERVRASFSEQAPSPVFEVVNDAAQRLLVILGDPGAGKSVLLEYLTLEWVEQPTRERTAQPIPLLIELKTYIHNLVDQHCKDFLEYLDHGVGTVGQLNSQQLDAVLEKGQAYFLLDGLDEIFDPAHRQMVVEQIILFTTRYPAARFVVTSRIIGYEQTAPFLRDAGFEHYLLQELDEEQQEGFIAQWHALAYADPLEREAKAARLRNSLTDSSAIRELAANPLLLTLMALLNRHQELPRDRNELYEQASRLMLHQWNAGKALQDDLLLADKHFDYKDKQAILRRVAHRMQTSEAGLAGNAIQEEVLRVTLMDYLRGEWDIKEPRPVAVRLIQQLRERNFILCLLGDDYYAFVHRTFLEFFCAWSFVWKYEQERSLSLEALEAQTFTAHWQDESWHEVLRLIVGRLQPTDANTLIANLLAKTDDSNRHLHIFLAAKCFADVRNKVLLGETGMRIETMLKELAEFDLPFYYFPEDEDGQLVSKVRCEAIRCAGMCLSNSLALDEWLQSLLTSDIDEVRRTTLRELARSRQSQSDLLTDMIGFAQHDDYAIRQAALQILARGWRTDPSTLPLLRDRIQNDKSKYVRWTAVQELARGWKADPGTLPLLREWVQYDNSEYVREAAVRELARGWRADLDTLPLLQERAQYDKSDDVRSMAVHELVRGWRTDPGTLQLVQERIQHDESEYVRWSAVQELAYGWRTDPDTLSLLREWALHDEHQYVRGAAVQELARRWRSDPGTLPLLRERAQHDASEDVRQAAVQELARGWRTDPSTLPLLQERARQDESEFVRWAAAHELARGWRADPSTLPLLRERARHDESEHVRYAVVRGLARGWRADPDTLPLLQKWAQHDESEYVRQVAVQALARGWQADPGTLPLLRERARYDESHDVRWTAAQELKRGWRDDHEVQAFLASISNEKEAMK